MPANRIFRLPLPAWPFPGRRTVWRALGYLPGLDGCERIYRFMSGSGRPDCQKAYAPLLLLWKGIGAVSIRCDYSDLSRRLIATTLIHHRQAKDLSTLVEPCTPLRPRPLKVRGCSANWPIEFCRDIEDVSSVIADIELAHQSVPVQLRHYLNLGGRLLAFNVDRSFGSVLDGLILVDLLDTAPRTLARYMGQDGVRDFLAVHRARGAKVRVG